MHLISFQVFLMIVWSFLSIIEAVTPPDSPRLGLTELFDLWRAQRQQLENAFQAIDNTPISALNSPRILSETTNDPAITHTGERVLNSPRNPRIGKENQRTE